VKFQEFQEIQDNWEPCKLDDHWNDVGVKSYWSFISLSTFKYQVSDKTVICSMQLKKLTLPSTTICHSSRCFLLMDCVLSAQQRFLCFVAVPSRDWYPGNPGILPNPKPRFGHLLNPRVSTFFGFAFLHLERCILMVSMFVLSQTLQHRPAWLRA